MERTFIMGNITRFHPVHVLNCAVFTDMVCLRRFNSNWTARTLLNKRRGGQMLEYIWNASFKLKKSWHGLGWMVRDIREELRDARGVTVKTQISVCVLWSLRESELEERVPTCNAKPESTQFVAETKAWLMTCLCHFSVSKGVYRRPRLTLRKLLEHAVVPTEIWSGTDWLRAVPPQEK